MMTPSIATTAEEERIDAVFLKSATEAIPIINGENFTVWRSRVEIMLDLLKLKKPLVLDTRDLTEMEDIRLRSILTSKLDDNIHANVITHENSDSAKLIWAALLKYFASSRASNRARVFKELLRLSFDPSNIDGFITKVKNSSAKLHQIGIILPADILAYLILDKLPNELEVIYQQITHSDKDITPELVLDHLVNHANDLAIRSKVKVENLLLFSSSDNKCRKGVHNPKAPHPEHKCWAVYPQLRPKPQGEAQVSAFVCSSTLRSSLFVLDSGASAHMISDITLFIALDEKEKGVIRTGSANETL